MERYFKLLKAHHTNGHFIANNIYHMEHCATNNGDNIVFNYVREYPEDWQECDRYGNPISEVDKTIEFLKPSDRQVGGNHYKNFAIQPIEFIMKNNLNFCQANSLKYLLRYKEKNGLQDLEKAKHYIELLIEYEYGNK